MILNPTFMLGSYDSGPSSGAMLVALYHRKVPGYTGGGKNYICAKDVAVTLANALTKGRIGECYILGNEIEEKTVVSDCWLVYAIGSFLSLCLYQ